jgi:hypothetical protein
MSKPTRKNPSALPFGKNTKTVSCKTLALYQEVVKPGSRWAPSLRRSFTIPRDLNPEGTIEHEDHEPYVMWRNITFCYHNEAVTIRVEQDEFGQDVFLLVFCNKIIGYFAPVASSAVA